MLETDSVQFGNTAIRYSIQRSDRRKKTIGISVDASGVKVSVPTHTDSSRLKQLVYKKAPWICDRLTHIQLENHHGFYEYNRLHSGTRTLSSRTPQSLQSFLAEIGSNYARLFRTKRKAS